MPDFSIWQRIKQTMKNNSKPWWKPLRPKAAPPATASPSATTPALTAPQRSPLLLGFIPQEVTRGTGTAADFPTVSFVRRKGLIGVAVNVEVGTSLDFTTTTLGAAITAVQDLGNGTERVTVRSTAPAKQFFRLNVSAN
jgi:hypothetical protein